MNSETDFSFGHNIEEQAKRDPETPWSGECRGHIVCPECNHFHGLCYEVKQEKEKLETMISEKGQQQGGGYSGGGNRRKRDGFPWLDNSMLSVSQRKQAKILAVRETEDPGPGRRKYSDYQCKIAFDGQTVMLGLVANRNFDQVFGTLVDSFGTDENNWIGKTFWLFLEQNDFNGRTYRRAIVGDEEPNKKGNRARS